MTSPETLDFLSPFMGQKWANPGGRLGEPSNPLFLHSERRESNPRPLPPQASGHTQLQILTGDFGSLHPSFDPRLFTSIMGQSWA